VFNGYDTQFVAQNLKRVRNGTDDVRAGQVRTGARPQAGSVAAEVR